MSGWRAAKHNAAQCNPMAGQAIAPILNSLNGQQDRGWGVRHAMATHPSSLSHMNFMRHICFAATALIGKAVHHE